MQASNLYLNWNYAYFQNTEIYILHKAEKPSDHLQFQRRPTIFSPADARIKALFVPNEALII